MCVDYTIYVFDYCRISVININFIFLEIPAIVTSSHICTYKCIYIYIKPREAYVKKKTNKSVQAQTSRSAKIMIVSVVIVYNL